MSKRLSNYKLNLAIIASLFFTLVLGCQPEGGELLPINNEGLEITSSRFENDTAVINDNGFEIKVFGSWDGRAKVRVIIENNSGNSVRFDFNKSIVLDSRGEKINIDSIYEDKNSAIEQISDGQFAVAKAKNAN